jgi:hypothetical protein
MKILIDTNIILDVLPPFFIAPGSRAGGWTESLKLNFILFISRCRGIINLRKMAEMGD